jgi:hypothetical protein
MPSGFVQTPTAATPTERDTMKLSARNQLTTAIMGVGHDEAIA